MYVCIVCLYIIIYIIYIYKHPEGNRIWMNLGSSTIVHDISMYSNFGEVS